MTNDEWTNKAGQRHAMRIFFILHFAFFIPLCRAAEQFGDLSVAPNAIYTGNTFHGYAEMRVILENDSSKAHVVTLVYPNSQFSGSAMALAACPAP
jgi:hypothetical protein